MNNKYIAGQITKKMIGEGLNKGLINVIPNPEYKTFIYEPVCKIGLYWFYFCGNDDITISQYYLTTSRSQIIQSIYDGLEGFKYLGEEPKDATEYNYYYYYLKENLQLIAEGRR